MPVMAVLVKAHDILLSQKILTSTIKVVCNVVQEGILRSKEALHHRHLVLDFEKENLSFQ